jgi:hypothetical protein
MAKWKYMGDINLEHGGAFFRLDSRNWDEYGYGEAVRVTPCSDAGGQDNAYWIEDITIIKPEPKELPGILSGYSWTIDPEDGSIIDCSGRIIAKARTAAFRLAIAEACTSYGRYDINRSETIQIGKDSPFYDGREPVRPDRILRANTSLERFVRREFLA